MANKSRKNEGLRTGLKKKETEQKQISMGLGIVQSSTTMKRSSGDFLVKKVATSSVVRINGGATPETDTLIRARRAAIEDLKRKGY